MALFRREAMAGRGQALEGAVSLAVPLSWQVVSAMLSTAVAVTALFLTIATTDRVVTLETGIDDTGTTRALLPIADAALLPPKACGTLTLRGRSDSVEACIVGRDNAVPRALSDGTVVDAHPVTLRLSARAPAGARGTARFVIGRESLWASLTR